jgi:hypothetical protein
MTDIVARIEDALGQDTFWDTDAPPLLNDAVAEIKRLRKERCWIPVSEQLPEDGQSVIACFEGGGMTGQVGEATFNKRGGWFSTERGAWCASHWMPLPEPPEAKFMLTDQDRKSIESAVTLTLKKMNFLGGATPEAS